jgi:oligopeptide transport system permease protein
MQKLIVQRLLQLPIILLVIYTLTLVLAWAVPGDPLDKGDGRAPPVAVQEAMKARYNLDSFWSFYFSYLDAASGLRYLRTEVFSASSASAQGPQTIAGTPLTYRSRIFDLGPSLKDEDWTVNDILGASLPVSVTIGASAMILAVIIGVLAGIVGAIRPRSFADVGTLIVALVGISLPSFVTGTLLLMIFGVWLGLAPVARWGTLADLFLPAFTLSLPFAAYITRLMRMGLIEVLGADYIRTARAKGVSESRLIFRHAIKNAFLPVLSYLGPATAFAMTGSFVVERVFNVPGLGQHFVNAVLNKDLFLIIGVVLTFSTMLILFNLAVDVLYRWIDPRIA